MDFTIEKYELYYKKMAEVADASRDAIKEVYQFIAPDRALRFDTDSPGEKPQVNFDSYAGYALQVFVDGIISNSISPFTPFIGVGTDDPRVQKNDKVLKFLKTLESAFYSYLGQSNFYTQLKPLLMDFAVGTGCMSIEYDRKRKKFLFITHHPGTVAFGHDQYGDVNMVCRTFTMPRYEVEQNWPGKQDPKTLEDDPLSKVEIRHIVLPDGAKYHSSYYIPADNMILGTAQFFTFPYIVPRADFSNTEPWGYGPARKCLADIKAMDSMSRSDLIAGQKAVEPPIQAPSEMEGKIDLDPNGISYYEEAGREIKITPIIGNFQVAEVQYDRKKTIIDGYFHVGFFQMLQQIQRMMTAYEVSERKNEKASGLISLAITINHQIVKPIVERMIDIIVRYGLVDDIPQEFKNVEINLDFISPMNLMQHRIFVEQDVRRLMEMGQIVAQFDPMATKAVKWEETFRMVAASSKIDPEMLVSSAEMKKEKDRMNQLQQSSAQAEIMKNAGQGISAVMRGQQ